MRVTRVGDKAQMEADDQVTERYHDFPSDEIDNDLEAVFDSGYFREHKDSAQGVMPLIVQFGSEQCALCPKATIDMADAVKAYDFVWKYEDVFKSETELAAELNVTALPALFVFHDQFKYKLYQRLRGDDVGTIVKAHCKPRLVLNAEF